METRHRVVVGDARRLDRIDDGAVDLVVTSPPYPMIEMWDDLFADLDPAVGDRLDAGDGRAAFDLMHRQLDEVWAEVARVLADGGIACVNVGDATRTVDGTFRVYGNHARVADAFEELGFEPLPDLLWRKPTNSAAKFMGSGMLPPNAYVTLEHEYVLVFRNGPEPRTFPPGDDRRYRSAYFWEERNRWFSDVWEGIGGEDQALDPDAAGDGDPDLRRRSGAYPLAIPYRLINMYSVQGDTVLDPFWGTGTTGLAAMAAARDSVGYEIEPALAGDFADRVGEAPDLSRAVARRRLDDHRSFVAADDGPFEYEAEHYDFPVRTKQERAIRLYAVDDVERTPAPDGVTAFRAVHVPVEGRAGAAAADGG
ncbi:MAG: site-specific DNA-methyltransferase [Haloferacaceae archaeon]